MIIRPLLLALLAPLATFAADPAYTIVVQEATAAKPEWKAVVDALQKKYPHATVATWKTGVDETLPTLQKNHPRYTCFVAEHQTASRAFVGAVHHLTRQYDADPYTDTFWGILTGYDAANALSIAQNAQPLTVKKVASGTELAMDKIVEGIWYCELREGHSVKKDAGKTPESRSGAGDSTFALVDTLNVYDADLFVTSGHATERDWQIGFRYKNGTFRARNGVLYGKNLKGEERNVDSPSPKVYLPIGNCLMGHIDTQDAMALAWMNSAGVHQMIGYTIPTWYGYAGWGLLDYFVEQPGRYTMNEAFIGNQHALMHRLTKSFPGMQEKVGFPQSLQYRPSRISMDQNMARKLGVKPGDIRGLIFDRDVVAFYGDPAWEARMAEHPLHYTQSLTRDGDTWTLTVTPNNGATSFAPVNTNGAQRGNRPIVAHLPARIGKATVLAGQEWLPEITDDFVLVPNPGSLPEGTQQVVVQFSAAKLTP